MNRYLTLGVCQMGPIQRAGSRAENVGRLVHLLERAAAAGAELAVFPELALTTFFPRSLVGDPREIDSFYEKRMPGAQTQPLFDVPRGRLRIGFALGYAELCKERGRPRRFNSMDLIGADGALVGRYRKMHIPGSEDSESGVTPHLERRYFEPGNLWISRSSAYCGVRIGLSSSATIGAGRKPIACYACAARRWC